MIEFAIDVISVLPVLSTVWSPAIKDPAPDRKMRAVVEELVERMILGAASAFMAIAGLICEMEGY